MSDAPTTRAPRAKKAAAPEAPKLDEIDTIIAAAIAAGKLDQLALTLMFWMTRHDNPEASVTVNLQDLRAFHQCVEYLGVDPHVRIFRPQGRPAREPYTNPKNGNTIPGRPADPPKDMIVIQMVDEDGNAITPVENNEQDYAKAAAANRERKLRDQAPELAAQLVRDVQGNQLSNQTILDAAETLRVLGRK